MGHFRGSTAAFYSIFTDFYENFDAIKKPWQAKGERMKKN